MLESPPLQQLFREQVRAILRAAASSHPASASSSPSTTTHGGQVRILIPLVTRSEILDFAVETVAKARECLTREGLDFVGAVPLGVMIEVAAAVPMLACWAEQVDFFALGTNDLTASALGLDRDDPVAAGQIDSLHPGLLRLVHMVVSDAHRARSAGVGVRRNGRRPPKRKALGGAGSGFDQRAGESIHRRPRGAARWASAARKRWPI